VFPRNYELLVKVGFARSLDDPATMTGDDRLWLGLENEPLIHTLEVRPASDQIQAISDRLLTQITAAVRQENVANSLPQGQVFTLGEWERATKVTFGSRGDQVATVATIDTLLPYYHAYRRRGNQAAWIRIACWIGDLAEEHLRTKLSFGAPKPATHRRPKSATMWVVLGGRIVLFGSVGKGRGQVVAV